MSGTSAGSKKAVATILAKNPNHFRDIGRIGGSRGTGGGFGDGEEGRARARLAGAKGGRISKRRKKFTNQEGNL
ncbi:general stress protein YciG [Arthrobacter sp. V1I9]|nr:general stress protein YciG [Arthrobacter sp. V1I9]